MPVHSLHIFDRKGKTLFTKQYMNDDMNDESTYSHTNPAAAEQQQLQAQQDDEQAEQRKLVFGMLFSLREVVNSLSPDSSKDSGLHSVKTGATTLYNYETVSGLRFALYVTNDNVPEATTNAAAPQSSSSLPASTTANYSTNIRMALTHIYNELWIQCVIRSPLYKPTQPNVQDTNFEEKVDAYLASHPWFR